LSKHNYSLEQGIDAKPCLPASYPFLKWAGGKTQILSELEKFVPSGFTRYFEPFLGGGALFFHLTTKRNIRLGVYLSDINEELITTYKVVKNKVEKLIALLANHQKDYNKNPKEFYYELRSIVPATDIEIAARMIALNKTCYNGLYRVNKRGRFNVPIRRYKNPIICNSDNLKNVSLSLRYSRAVIQPSDYKQVLENAREGDFVYLDPPFDPPSSTSSFTSYTTSGFYKTDQKELSDVFRELNERRCKVLLSNSNTEYIRELYSEFAPYFKEINVSRAINCKASKRTGHKELLITNYR
jgi:DNA adenine methylase